MGVKATKKPVDYPLAAGAAMSVREAKAQFSSLVARAAAGQEITITWHGRPRARLAPVRAEGEALRVDRAWLKSMPVRGHGRRSEELVRADRDAKG
jgi:prevent-host-death family protein